MFQETSRADNETDRAKTAPVFASNSNQSDRSTALSNTDADLEPFMRPSTKRRRTNQMQTAKDQIPVLAQPALESDLYSHQHSQSEQFQTDSSTHSHSHSHPYHSRRTKSPVDGLDALLHDQHKEKSPEKLFERMNLNGFEIHNRENEAVTEWKHSIEAQLNEVRNGPSDVHELCRRIQEARGLGKAVLVAKLRQRVGEEAFESVMQRMQMKSTQSTSGQKRKNDDATQSIPKRRRLQYKPSDSN